MLHFPCAYFKHARIFIERNFPWIPDSVFWRLHYSSYVPADKLRLLPRKITLNLHVYFLFSPGNYPFAFPRSSHFNLAIKSRYALNIHCMHMIFVAIVIQHTHARARAHACMHANFIYFNRAKYVTIISFVQLYLHVLHVL